VGEVSSGNRADVRDFLVTRRVPGLRREEVAMLAVVSADYYRRHPPQRQVRRDCILVP
jgi:hypothetical protein